MHIYDTYIDLAKNIFDSQNIQTTILDESFEHIHQIDYSFRANLYPSQNPYKEIKNWLTNECVYPNIYIIESASHICNIYFKLPDTGSSYAYMCIGPFLFEPLSDYEAKSIMDNQNLSPQIQNELITFYHNLPITISRDRFQAFISVLFAPILGADMRIIHHITSESLDDLTPVDDFNHSISEGDLSLSLLEQRYDIEKQMISAIKKQDVEEAILLHNKMIQFNYGQRTSNALRNTKNFSIVFNTILRIAAKECDVHPFYIDKISRQFAIDIEQCTNELQLKKLATEMIRKYCLLIHNYSLKNFSPNIQECVEYINFHFNDELTLHTMADHLNLNASYLSSLFKKEIGITLTTYVTQVRIKQSLFLLNSTKYSIQDIADQCGFDDINYFSRIFKKYQGLSPSSYRKMLKN